MRGTKMEGDILISASNYRSEGKKLYVNCLIKKKEEREKKKKEQSDATLMTKYYSIRRCIMIQANVNIIEAPIESDTKQ